MSEDPRRRQSDALDLSGVPAWVIRLVGDVSETRTIVRVLESRMTEVAMRIDSFISRREYDAHLEQAASVTRDKLNPLWDDHQALKGQLAERERNNRLWRYGLALAVAILGAVEAALHR